MLGAAWASIACMVVVIVALSVRGASDWSNEFALFWFATWVAAVILAVVGIVEAAVKRNAEPQQRVLGLALCIATLAITALIAGWILIVLSSLS